MSLGREQAADDEARFAAFVQTHARLAFRVAYALLRDASDAEDAVQECFLKLHRRGGWQRGMDERAYLARAAWRAALDLRARQLRAASTDEYDEPASATPSPERQAVAGDALARVHRLIDALPETLRFPLVLCSVEGMSSAEAAVALKLPEGTVRRRVKEARALLREKLNAMEGGRGGR